jgi:subtilisin family serine protease
VSMLIRALLLLIPILSAGSVVFSSYQTPEFAALMSAAQAQGQVRVIVGFNPSAGRTADVRRALAAAAFSEPLSNSANWQIPYVALSVNDAGLRALANDPRVTSIQIDGTYTTSLASSIPVIRADQAWGRGIDGTGWTIAVLDTGVEATHPFFGGRVVEEACFSGGGFADSLCPNDEPIQIGAGAASPAKCTGYAGCAHGTHVSGIAVGSSVSFSGVARSANLIGVQVFSLLGSLTAYDSDIISGMNHVYSLRSSYAIAAVNLSLSDGTFRTTTCDIEKAALKAAVDLLRSAEIPTIAATGNQGYATGITAPACISSVIAVGASTDGDLVASFSNRAPIMDFFAPGVSITSSIMNGLYGIASGTSMAAPHVSGTLALLRQHQPSSSLDRVLRALRLSGKPLAIIGASIPRIDVIGALDALDGLPLPNWIVNGDFANGFASWFAWDGTDAQMPGQWIEMRRLPGTTSALIAQNTGVSIPANTGLQAQVELGNTSGVRKRVGLFLHRGDWQDLAMCSFWLEPFAPPSVYTMITTTQFPWTRTHLSIYLSPDDGIGWLYIDNVSLRPLMEPVNLATLCYDPNAPG